MKRDQHRRSTENGYYRTHPCEESFTCQVCGRTVTPAGDNPVKLLSLAMRPVSSPPFPIERIRELAELMDGDNGQK